MNTSHNYATTTEALKELDKAGYKIDYNIEFDDLLNHASDYEIEHLYRYEGQTDPADESTVYGIRNIKTGDKGIFVAGNLSLIEGKKRDIILEMEIRYKQKR